MALNLNYGLKLVKIVYDIQDFMLLFYLRYLMYATLIKKKQIQKHIFFY